MNFRAVTALLAIVTLSGCVIFGGPADRALRRTPAFKDGYADGCNAATTPSANPREEPDSLANTDKIYRRGYAQGLQNCRRTTVSPGTVPAKGLNGGVPTPGGY
jgi:hypothetical protein